MNYRVYYKRENGLLSLKVYEEDHFQKVAGLAEYNLRDKGYALAWRGSAAHEMHVLVFAIENIKAIEEEASLCQRPPTSPKLIATKQ